MKISVSSYSYSNVMSDNFTLFDVIDHVKKTGFDGMEFIHGYKIGDYSVSDTAKILGDKCREAGLEVYSYDGGVDFLAPDFENQIESGKEMIDCAEALGALALRIDTIGWSFKEAGPDGLKGILRKASEGARILADYAGEKGMKLMVENHGQIFQDSTVVEKLINKVGRENYGAQVDIGNFLCADENPTEGVGRLSRYVMHVHMKDFHFKSGNEVFLPSRGWFGTRGGNYLRGAMLGHGIVPVYQCVRILKNNGYDGAISLEFEGMENGLMAVEEGYRVMRKALELIG